MPDAFPIAPTDAASLEAAEPGTSLWKDALHRLKKNRLAVIGCWVLVLLLSACVLGPRAWPYSYETINLELREQPPNGTHWLGTDHLGRDLLARLLYGGRVSLMVGICATGVALLIGVLYGAISGYVGGKVDALMMRIVDMLYAIPFTIFVILLMVFCRDLGSNVEQAFLKWFGWQVRFGPYWNMMLLFGAIGFVEWLTMARIVRGQVMSLKQQEFIEAAIALGLRKRRIILRHTIPNVLGPIIVYATLTIPMVMLLEAFLSFLGLGVQPPMSSWGVLIKEGAERMEETPWLLLFPGAALALTLFSLNFLGDGLRDALDVRAAKD